jgi:hypothetical protein
VSKPKLPDGWSAHQVQCERKGNPNRCASCNKKTERKCTFDGKSWEAYAASKKSKNPLSKAIPDINQQRVQTQPANRPTQDLVSEQAINARNNRLYNSTAPGVAPKDNAGVDNSSAQRPEQREHPHPGEQTQAENRSIENPFSVTVINDRNNRFYVESASGMAPRQNAGIGSSSAQHPAQTEHPQQHRLCVPHDRSGPGDDSPHETGYSTPQNIARSECPETVYGMDKQTLNENVGNLHNASQTSYHATPTNDTVAVGLDGADPDSAQAVFSDQTLAPDDVDMQNGEEEYESSDELLLVSEAQRLEV